MERSPRLLLFVALIAAMVGLFAHLALGQSGAGDGDTLPSPLSGSQQEDADTPQGGARLVNPRVEVLPAPRRGVPGLSYEDHAETSRRLREYVADERLSSIDLDIAPLKRREEVGEVELGFYFRDGDEDDGGRLELNRGKPVDVKDGNVIINVREQAGDQIIIQQYAVPVGDLDDGSRETFRRTWKQSWTRRGESEPFLHWARIMGYVHGRVELRTIQGNTSFIELANLSDEDQDWFRERWRLPGDYRVWTNRDDKPVMRGRLYDVRYGRLIVQSKQDTFQSMPLSELSEESLWYFTRGWSVPSIARLQPDPAPWVDGNTMRDFTMITFMWKASGLCHKPLYFEEVELERYGHSFGPLWQPVISGAHFFGNIAIVPYKMGIHPPHECIYALGYYRPGSCAPYMIPAVPWSVRGGLYQAGAVVGGAAIIP